MTNNNTTTVFKSQLVADTADMIKAAGLKVYVSLWSSSTSKPTYFYFTDGENIGYCQEGYFGGIMFSTVHKPCRECGTGYRLTDDPGTYQPTIEDAKQAFIMFPKWAKHKDRAAVKKYSTWAEYATKNNSCEYLEY
jgi:hypothetical protein